MHFNTDAHLMLFSTDFFTYSIVSITCCV